MRSKKKYCMNVLEMLMNALYEKNKGLIRVGKVMNALYEKNKGLIRVGKEVMNCMKRIRD